MSNSFQCKVNTEEGVKYYKLEVVTQDMKQIDEILDQILKTEGVFISEEDFNNNIKNPMTLDVMDSETEEELIAKLTFEAIDLEEVTDEKQVNI